MSRKKVRNKSRENPWKRSGNTMCIKPIYKNPPSSGACFTAVLKQSGFSLMSGSSSPSASSGSCVDVDAQLLLPFVVLICVCFCSCSPPSSVVVVVWSVNSLVVSVALLSSSSFFSFCWRRVSLANWHLWLKSGIKINFEFLILEK